MPHNLDDRTRTVIVGVTSFTTCVIGSFALYAQLVVIPRLKRRLSTSSPKRSLEEYTPPPLFLWCLLSITIMAVASVVLTLAIVTLGGTNKDPGAEILRTEDISSSINFCEDDFQDSSYVAEPANTASSIVCYLPLALLGVLGPQAREWSAQQHGGPNWRFALAYIALLAIGIGSTGLHALLSASAQGGDELPMLWFTAAAAFCAIDIVLEGRRWTDNCKAYGARPSWLWLHRTFAASAVVATAVYVLSRENFLFFYAMFSIYSQVTIFGVVYICFILPWEKGSLGQDSGNAFRVAVLLPLGMITGLITILAVWTWVIEMLYCTAATRDLAYGNVLAPFLLNRTVHPFWHFSSGILAWLLIQLLISAHGYQRGWGEPSFRWFGVPYVIFEPKNGVHLFEEKAKDQ